LAKGRSDWSNALKTSSSPTSGPLPHKFPVGGARDSKETPFWQRRTFRSTVYTPTRTHTHPHTHTHTHIAAKMVKLEEVMDEEFVREQDGPHDDDDWDTDSGTTTQALPTEPNSANMPCLSPRPRVRHLLPGVAAA